MSTRGVYEFYDVPEVEGGELGSPTAVVYQHGDMYPESDAGALYRLKYLEKILAANIPSFGPRLSDPEWAAAEMISQFRVASDAPPDPKSKWQHIGEGNFVGGHRHRGGLYVTNSVMNHSDIEFLYRIICRSPKWEIRVFRPILDDSPGFNIVGFEEISKEELRKREVEDRARLKAVQS